MDKTWFGPPATPVVVKDETDLFAVVAVDAALAVIEIERDRLGTLRIWRGGGEYMLLDSPLRSNFFMASTEPDAVLFAPFVGFK